MHLASNSLKDLQKKGDSLRADLKLGLRLLDFLKIKIRSLPMHLLLTLSFKAS